MTIQGNVNKLKQIKSDIKLALTNKGANPNDNFTTYAGLINNLTEGESSTGGGDVVEALNMTGEDIFAGQKVWLNGYSIVPDSEFRADSAGIYNGHSIRVGDFLYNTRSNNIYKIEGDQAILYKTIDSYSNYLDGYEQWYNGDVLVIGESNKKILRGGDIIPTGCSVAFCGINSNLFMSGDNIYRIDLSTGEKLKTYTGSSYPYTIDKTYFYLDGKIMNCSADNGYWPIIFDEANSTWTTDNHYIRVYDRANNYNSIVGITPDERFVLCRYNNDFDGQLMIYEYLGNDAFRFIPYNEVPEELKPFYYGGGATNNDVYVSFYNSNANILTAYNRNTKEYVFMSYENGKWVKQSYDVDFASLSFSGYYNSFGLHSPNSFMFADDRSQLTISVNKDNSGNYNVYVLNLKADKGNRVYKYSLTYVNESSVTAFAKDNVAPGQVGEFLTIMPKKSDFTITVNADNATILVGDE